MEAVAILFRTIVILTLSTGPVFVDLDEPVSPAGALQIAQEVAKQDFEAIGAKVYYCISLPLVSGQEKFQVSPRPIAKVSKDWGPTFSKEHYAPQVMVITTRDFKTQGELAQAIKEARPKARHITRSWKDIMRPLPLDEKAYAVELHPEEAARFQIAEILVEEGKYAEAVKELEEIVKSTANEEVKNLVRARISTIYAKMGLDEKSEGELKKIIESTTNLELEKRVLMTLAGIYRSQKRYDEAVATLRRVIELTEPDVMKLLQFRKEFMPEGFIFSAVERTWPITGNPGWMTQEGLSQVADRYRLGGAPRRGYECIFDKKVYPRDDNPDDLYYSLLEFEDEKTAAAAAGVFSENMRKEQSDRFFGGAFAASNVVVIVAAEKADYIPAALWLVTTLLKALPAHLQAEVMKARPTGVTISGVGRELTRAEIMEKLNQSVSFQIERISVQYAVIEIAKRIGLRYDWETSSKNTNPERRRWTQMRFTNVKAKDALEQILSPVGLTYVIEFDRIYLIRGKKPKVGEGR